MKEGRDHRQGHAGACRQGPGHRRPGPMGPESFVPATARRADPDCVDISVKKSKYYSNFQAVLTMETYDKTA